MLVFFQGFSLPGSSLFSIALRETFESTKYTCFKNISISFFFFVKFLTLVDRISYSKKESLISTSNVLKIEQLVSE